MSHHSLIRVYSCWSLGEAEIVRMRLASEGIPSYFENANFINWCWYYANAAGGVKLLVRRPDADEARRILLTVDHRLGDDGPSWTCSRCGQSVYETWCVCWSCCRTIDGEDPAPDSEEPPEGFDDRGPGINPAATIPSALMILTLLAMLCGASPATVVLLLVVILTAFCAFGCDMGGSCEHSPSNVPNADGRMTKEIANGDDNPPDPATWAADETARRAWQAAVLGSLFFPPLLLSVFSIWLLLGRLRKETALSRIGRRRIRAAWTVNAITIPLSIGILSELFADSFQGLLWRYTCLLDSFRDSLM